MPRVIDSPVKQFPGQVELPDAVTFPQYIAYQDALTAAREENGARQNFALLPGLLACVLAWRLENVPEHPTVETFPASPPVAVSRLLAWIIAELSKMIHAADDSPNG